MFRQKNTGMGIGKAVGNILKGFRVNAATPSAVAKKAPPKPKQPTIVSQYEMRAKKIADINAEIEKINRY